MNKHKLFFEKLSESSRYLDYETTMEFYYGILRTIIAMLKQGGALECPDLGRFEIIENKPTRYVNVNTGMLENKNPIKLVKFRPCRKLKEFIKNC
jgi:nucleoid DNA-binding protein